MNILRAITRLRMSMELDAALAKRRATRIAYRNAQSGRADKEAARLRGLREKFEGRA